MFVDDVLAPVALFRHHLAEEGMGDGLNVYFGCVPHLNYILISLGGHRIRRQRNEEI